MCREILLPFLLLPKSTNQNRNRSHRFLLAMIGGKSLEKNYSILFFSLSLALVFFINLIILFFSRREINAILAEKSTSHIHHHHHHSIRHLCFVECVNFKRRNKKLLFLLFAYFLELKKNTSASLMHLLKC